MSHNSNTTSRRRTAVSVGVAAGAAFAAGLISLGAASMANAAPGDPYVPVTDIYGVNNPYDVLFGSYGTQGVDNAALDTTISPNPDFSAFNTDVDTFEASDTHGLENLIFSLDPSAFYEQVGGGAVGTLADGAYLVPADGLGYLATGLDFGLLSPIGLEYVLTPVLDSLAATP